MLQLFLFSQQQKSSLITSLPLKNDLYLYAICCTSLWLYIYIIKKNFVKNKTQYFVYPKSVYTIYWYLTALFINTYDFDKQSATNQSVVGERFIFLGKIFIERHSPS